MTHRAVAVAAAVAVLSAAGIPQAAVAQYVVGPVEPGVTRRLLAFQRTEKISATAVVDSVDLANRKVTLTGPRGTETVTVPADVANLNEIKPGDKVVIALSPYDLSKGRIIFRNV